MKQIIHQTDLFRPHQDPDDHFDLACQYALQKRSLIRLEGIMVDYPPPDPLNGDPDLQAIMQLAFLTKSYARIGIGSNSRREPSGAKTLLIDSMQNAHEPIALHVAGSCRDVADAVTEYPDLFKEKCSALYLYAGSAQGVEGLQEYNVALDPDAFRRVITAPCPVYWLPCFDRTPDWGREDMSVGRNGSFFRIYQADILPHLSKPMQNYFISTLTREEGVRFIQSILSEPDPQAILRFSAMERNMWCTPGILHAAGMTVLPQGDIIPINTAADGGVFCFVPVRLSCDLQGNVTWVEDKSGKDFIFTITSLNNYKGAMTGALRTLLQVL